MTEVDQAAEWEHLVQKHWGNPQALAPHYIKLYDISHKAAAGLRAHLLERLPDEDFAKYNRRVAEFMLDDAFRPFLMVGWSIFGPIESDWFLASRRRVVGAVSEHNFPLLLATHKDSAIASLTYSGHLNLEDRVHDVLCNQDFRTLAYWLDVTRSKPDLAREVLCQAALSPKFNKLLLAAIRESEPSAGSRLAGLFKPLVAVRESDDQLEASSDIRVAVSLIEARSQARSLPAMMAP